MASRSRQQRPFLIGLIVLLIGSIIGGVALSQAAFGTSEDQRFAQALWRTLGEQKLVGEHQITHVPYQGRAPHGAILEALTSTITVNGITGEVIVKRNYGGPGVSPSAVANDRGRFLGAVTVMFKRKPGYDAQGKDWFWAKYLPDGSLDKAPNGTALAGRVAGCIACHSTAAGGGMVFTTTKAYLEQ